MTPETRLLLWCWFTLATVALVLYPVDSQLLPVWLWLRLRLFGLNCYMRAYAFRLWLGLPRPRPPFRFIPIQHRSPL